jgi:hypothetical protein
MNELTGLGIQIRALNKSMVDSLEGTITWEKGVIGVAAKSGTILQYRGSGKCVPTKQSAEREYSRRGRQRQRSSRRTGAGRDLYPVQASGLHTRTRHA